MQKLSNKTKNELASLIWNCELAIELAKSASAAGDEMGRIGNDHEMFKAYRRAASANRRWATCHLELINDWGIEASVFTETELKDKLAIYRKQEETWRKYEDAGDAA